jgi:hypothetical protein
MRYTRRQFIAQSLAATAATAAASALSIDGRFAAGATTAGPGTNPAIDRKAVVMRHNPVVHAVDPFSALSVGNGQFAFTADVTGLQTFLDPYKAEFPLCTASHWGWHITPAPPGVRREDFRYKMYNAHGKSVGYATDSTGQVALFNWLRENPHRLHLGRIGLILTHADKSPAKVADLSAINQTLDLWSGTIDSRFQFDGSPVRVQTVCDPDEDTLAVRIDSPLIRDGRLGILVAFPYGTSNLDMADWNSDARHTSDFSQLDRRADIYRTLDADHYAVTLGWSDGGSIAQTAKHQFTLSAKGSDTIEFAAMFLPQPTKALFASNFSGTQSRAAKHWEAFWTTGGFVDFGDCTDTRAPEIERRVILSMYNTALHDAGSLPSAETGLLNNGPWFGKFHLEMHWWHSAHFAQWNRINLLLPSLAYYSRILPQARQNATRQGYAGVRWPKMVGPDGLDSPSTVAPLLVWQQPHPIFYAELCYRAQPNADTLAQWRDIVFATADFMASYPALDATRGGYVLGPPMKTVSENADTNTTAAPTFELAYWRFGLRVANQWRQRMNLAPDPHWQEIHDKLAPLPQANGLYLMQDDMPDTYTKWNYEHPALIGALGMQPGDGVDPAIMKATVAKVIDVWRFAESWGWDFPMVAMCAARTGQPDLAVKALLIDVPKNRYHPNGHNYQRANLTSYLPGNGGLLYAIAMMCAGWTGNAATPANPAPGFPGDGKWKTRWENLQPCI